MAVLENPRPLISTIKRDIPGNHPQACERFSAWLPALQIFQDQRLDQKIPHIPIAIIGTWIFMHGVHGVPSPLFDPCAPDREVAKTVNLFEICPPPRCSHWRHHDIAPDLIAYNSVTSACCKGESGLTIYKKTGWMGEI
jgi:hypothetical protein